MLGALTLDNRLLVIPWPLKMDRGYIFTPVCFSLCEHDISRSYGRIRTKLGGQLWCVTRTHLLDFVEDLDLETRIFSRVALRTLALRELRVVLLLLVLLLLVLLLVKTKPL